MDKSGKWFLGILMSFLGTGTLAFFASKSYSPSNYTKQQTEIRLNLAQTRSDNYSVHPKLNLNEQINEELNRLKNTLSYPATGLDEITKEMEKQIDRMKLIMQRREPLAKSMEELAYPNGKYPLSQPSRQ